MASQLKGMDIGEANTYIMWLKTEIAAIEAKWKEFLTKADYASAKGSGWWQGDDADRFNNYWKGEVQKGFSLFQVGLNTQFAEMQRNLNEQMQASGLGGTTASH